MAHLSSLPSTSCRKSLCAPSPCRCQAVAHRCSRPRQHARTGICSTERLARRQPGRSSLTCCASAVLSKAPDQLDVTKMEPLGDRLLIKPEETKKVTEGGLLLTSGATKAMQDADLGKVLAKGEDVDVAVNVGDTVLFSRYSTSDVKLPEGEIVFVAQKSILAVLS